MFGWMENVSTRKWWKTFANSNNRSTTRTLLQIFLQYNITVTLINDQQLILFFLNFKFFSFNLLITVGKRTKKLICFTLNSIRGRREMNSKKMELLPLRSIEKLSSNYTCIIFTSGDRI